MFNLKTLQQQKTQLKIQTARINNLYDIIKKLEQQQRKSEKLFIDALNEQREKIAECIKVIVFLCNKNGIKLINKKEQENGKGKENSKNSGRKSNNNKTSNK